MGVQLRLPPTAALGQIPLRCAHCGAAQVVERPARDRARWWQLPCVRCGRQMLRRLTRPEVAAWQRGMDGEGPELAAKAVEVTALE